MIKAVIFGGTTEGRRLCELCANHEIPVVYCVATGDGARFVKALSGVESRVGRLGVSEMIALFEHKKPSLVIDATHPYAQEAGENIAAACEQSGVTLIRIHRESVVESSCVYFSNVCELISWLEGTPGNIFLSTGSSKVAEFTKLNDYQNRIWLRILPSLGSLKMCLELGFRAEQMICMQGPFSQELNRAMFQSANASILVTKDSGEVGGFSEKVRAARSLGMVTAVLSKPEEAGECYEDASHVSVEEAFEILLGL